MASLEEGRDVEDRRRSFMGEGSGAWRIGGVGSWVAGAGGEASMLCRARQVARRVE